MAASTLRSFRKSSRITQRELAQRLCVHYITIAKYETGERPIPAYIDLAVRELAARTASPGLFDRLAPTKVISPDELKRLRKAHGMTQEQLAVKLGLRRQAVLLYETGKQPIPPYIDLAVARLLPTATRKNRGRS